MLLELQQIFQNEGMCSSFVHQLDFSSVDLNGIKPFTSEIEISGQVCNRAGVVSLRYDTAFDFSVPCDRCGKMLSDRFKYTFEHVLVSSLAGDEDNDLLLVDEFKLDLDELVYSDILLELPSKYLCSPDCKGLCGKCGKNLNEGDCGCAEQEVDPRLAILKELLDN